MLRPMLGLWKSLALCTFLVLDVACASTPSEPVQAPAPLPVVRNPTGDCLAPPDNGARPGHGPGHARYLPDCKAPLRRQYYRVFAESESRAWMFPRPDNASGSRAVCASEAAGSPLRTLFEKYTLCAEAPDVERVNVMTPADGLAIARALHERMRFVANGGDVQPFPYDDDVLAVCDENPELAQGVLADRCAYVREQQRLAKLGPLPDIGREAPDAEGPPLAAALNELYGVAP